MDALSEIIAKPAAIIQAEFEKTKKLCIPDVMAFFEKHFNDEYSVLKIPSLNDSSPQFLRPNSLVRFRCMVQDMHDPEFAMGVYETVNRKTSEKSLKLGLFRENVDGSADEEICFNSELAVTIERQNLYCVPVPGESIWVKQKYSEMNEYVAQDFGAQSSSLKRQRSDDDDMETDSVSQEEKSQKDNAAPAEASKRHCAAQESTAQSSCLREDSKSNAGDFDFNFPLPGEKGAPCIVTVYENQDKFRINEIYEFIGILSVDPYLATATLGSKTEEDENIHMWPDTMSPEEKSALHPPASLVPRLHCVLAKRIKCLCPMLSSGRNNIGQEQIPSIRAELIQILTRLLYGDELAAEYVLLNIISRVYGRADVLALGKLSLNLTNCAGKKDSKCTIGKDLYDFILAIVVKSHYISLSINNLNSLQAVPKKDYQSNRLKAGVLQVAEGTHFFLDETEMQPGQLNEQGVKNITAIGNVIQWQKVDYDFSFQSCEILTDIPIIVVSEGRSLFQCDCLLPLKKKDHSSPTASSLLSSVSKDLLDKIRTYIAYVRDLEYNLSSEMQEQLKEDFTHSREVDSKSMDADIFQLLLVTARLYSLSYGRQELTPAFWTKTKSQDMARRERIMECKAS